LCLLHGTLWLTIDEIRLFAFELRFSRRDIGTKLRLISFKRALEEVAVSEIEATLAQGIFEHEAVIEGAILPELHCLA